MSSDVRAASSSEGRPPRIVGPAPGDWFFYGSLKPSQPGWDQIIDLIEARVDADAVGWTVTRRDGLPLLEQWDEQEDAVAPGIVVRAKAGCEDELKTRLKRIENDSVYRVTNVRVRVKPGEGQLEGVEYAWAWVAKDHGRDRGLPLPQGWGLEHDELFARGFPVLFDYLKPCIERITRGERNDHDYWTSFIFPLEGGFLVLCSMLERLAIVRDKAPGKTTDRIEALDSHPAATHAAITARPPQVTVFVANSRERMASVWLEVPTESRDGELYVPFQAWYTVRSNLAHQGKEPLQRNIDLITRSAAGVFDTLAILLTRMAPSLSEEWQRFGFDYRVDRLSALLPDAERFGEIGSERRL